MYEFLNNVIVAVKKVPSLSNMSDQMIMAGFAIFVIAVLLFIAFMIFASVDFVSTEQHEHHAPDSHKVIMDLHNALIKEMKGTSKQNSLMINLTILFISVSVIGIVISVVGPAATVDFCKNFISGIVSWIQGPRPATTR